MPGFCKIPSLKARDWKFLIPMEPDHHVIAKTLLCLKNDIIFANWESYREVSIFHTVRVRLRHVDCLSAYKGHLIFGFPQSKTIWLVGKLWYLDKDYHTSGKQYHCNQRQFRMYWNVGSRTNMINQRHLITGFPQSQFHFPDPRTIPRSEGPLLPDSDPDDPEQDVNMRKIQRIEWF